MRVVVTGATGNVGTSVLRALTADDRVESILGLARRLPRADFPNTTFATAEVAEDDLVPHFRGADVVVHLAWLIQPSRDTRVTRRANVDGSARVFRAVREAGAEIAGVATVVDRDTGAREAIEAEGVPYRALLGLADIGLA